MFGIMKLKLNFKTKKYSNELVLSFHFKSLAKFYTSVQTYEHANKTTFIITCEPIVIFGDKI